MNDSPHAISVPRSLRLKVKAESYAWLNTAAMEVNTVWNWGAEISGQAAHPCAGRPKRINGFDLNNLSSGASKFYEKIGAQTLQRVNGEYAAKRQTAKRYRLRWRSSRGPRCSLRWVPFKAASLRQVVQ